MDVDRVDRVNALVGIYRQMGQAAQLDLETRKEQKRNWLIDKYEIADDRDLVASVVSTFIHNLSGEFCNGLDCLVPLEPSHDHAAARRAKFTQFTDEVEVVHEAYLKIKKLQIFGAVQIDWIDIGENRGKLNNLVESISAVFEHYERNDLPRDTKMMRLNQDKYKINLYWKDCVYINLGTIFLMSDYVTCSLPSENAKTALGASLHEDIENSTTVELLSRISTPEDASSISKKIENALLIWNRKKRQDPGSRKYAANIATCKSMLFNLKYKFPSWEPKIGSWFVDRNKHVGLAYIEGYSRAVEALVSKVNQFLCAAEQTLS